MVSSNVVTLDAQLALSMEQIAHSVTSSILALSFISILLTIHTKSMRLWQKIKNTVYRPDFFGSHSFELSRGLHFYSFLIILYVVIQGVFMLPAAVRFYQGLGSNEAQQVWSTIRNLYPEELVLTFQNGTLSTNVMVPYAIAFPDEWRTTRDNQSNSVKIPKNLVVIDTTKPVTPDDFATLDTTVILGEKSVGYHDPNKGAFRIIDYRSQGDQGSFVVTRAAYTGFLDKIASVLRVVLLIGFCFLPFFLYAAFWVFHLIYLLFGALVVWLGAALRGHHMTYGRAYVAGLYLLPLPLLYSLLSSIIGAQSGIPFTFSLILFGIAFLNFPKVTPVVLAPITPAPTPIESSVTSEGVQKN